MTGSTLGAELERPSAPAVLRNRDSILGILVEEFSDRNRVLEIGSGTGEHAVYFAPKLPWLTWQTSDRRMNHAGIVAWLEALPAANLVPPLALDVADAPELECEYDGVFSANTAHIMSEAEVEQMFALVGRVLLPTGKFCLYGPFNVDGQFTSESNQRFDASLRAQQAHMGIRDLEWLDGLAAEQGLTRSALYAMPANNFIAAWLSA